MNKYSVHIFHTCILGNKMYTIVVSFIVILEYHSIDNIRTVSCPVSPVSSFQFPKV